MTTLNPTGRMIEFFGSGEAEEYAAKLQLRFAPIFAEDGHTRTGVAKQCRKQVARLYDMFEESDDDQPIRQDVPDLSLVDWGQLADLITIDKDHRWNK